MKTFRTFILAAVALLPAACATPPQAHSFARSRVYQEDYDTVWTHVVQFFASRNIQIQTIEKASGLIYAKNAQVALGAQTDCGNPGIAMAEPPVASLNVFVQKTPAGTEVTVNTEMKQVRRFEQNVWVQSCVSTGAIEGAILGAI